MKLIFSRMTMMCAGLAGVLFAGCSSNDLYNPEAVREKAEQAFGMTIDPNQDWNMLAAIKGNVSIKEDALSNYTIKIYTADPLNGKSGAALLAEQTVATDAQGNASASLSFDLPSYLQYVYVARVDDHGRRLVKTAKVSDGTVKVGFGDIKQTRAAGDTYEVPVYEAPYATEAAVEAEVADASSVSFSGEYGKNTKEVFRISQDATYNYSPVYGAWDNPTEEVYVIIEKGATLNWEFNTISMGDKIKTYDIIVKSGGTLNFTGSQSQDLLGKARLIVMPEGKVTGTTIQSGLAQDSDKGLGSIYNEGTIEVEKIQLLAANIYNNGIIKADVINAPNGGSIINNGKIKCREIGKDSGANNGAIDIKTNCLFRCTEYLKCGSITLGSNAAIEVPEIAIYGDIYLNQDCIIRATNIGHMGNTKIHAPTNISNKRDFPLISFPTLMYFTNNDGSSAKIEGQLFIEYNTITGESNGAEAHWESRIKDLANQKGTDCSICRVGEAPTSIPGNNETDLFKADCTGTGNTPKNQGGSGNDNLQYYSYAFEDLDYNGGDYDMNDVVLRCSAVQDGKITVQLVAAGASKNLFVYFKNQLLFGGEVHQAFGVEAGKLINTGAGPSAGVLTETIEVGNGFSYLTNGDFYIKDETGRESHIPAFQSGFTVGDAPYAILVPSDWKYPKETVRIETAYPGFKAWAANATQSGDWYNDYDASKVY